MEGWRRLKRRRVPTDAPGALRVDLLSKEQQPETRVGNGRQSLAPWLRKISRALNQTVNGNDAHICARMCLQAGAAMARECHPIDTLRG